jgi:hypothetical protein
MGLTVVFVSLYEFQKLLGRITLFDDVGPQVGLLIVSCFIVFHLLKIISIKYDKVN